MISVIISNYNGLFILKKCLEKTVSVLNHSGISEIILVDDGSHDESVQYVSNHFPSIIIHQLNRNVGFALANNAAAEIASNPILLFLNNDMVPNFINVSSIKKSFSDHRLFALGPTIIRQKDGIEFDEAHTFGYFQWGHLKTEVTDLVYPNKDLKEGDSILWGCGGAIFVCKEKFLKLGGFDSLYFPFYVEDVDLSYHAWKKGFCVKYTQKSVFFHNHQSTNATYFSQKYIRRVSKRNYYLFIWKMFSDKYYLFCHILFILFKIVTFQLRDIVAIYYAVLLIPEVLKRRRCLKFKLTDREVLQHWCEFKT